MLNLITALLMAWLSISRPELSRGETYTAHATIATDHRTAVELRGPAWLAIDRPTRVITTSTTLAYTVTVSTVAPFGQIDELRVIADGVQLARTPIRTAEQWPKRLWLPLVARRSA